MVRLFAADFMDATERLASALKSVEGESFSNWVTDVSYGWQFLLIPRRACSNYENRRKSRPCKCSNLYNFIKEGGKKRQLDTLKASSHAFARLSTKM